MLHPQGKNVVEPEITQLSNALASSTWQLPECEEYKGDLVQPAFLGLPGVPLAASTAMVPQPKIDPNAPATDDQWKKLAKMAA